MTNKRILDITTKKKQDNMVVVSNIVAGTGGGGTTYNNQPPILSGTFTYILPWICTARSLYRGAGTDKGAPVDTATRTAHTCYMRGLKERIQIQSNGGAAWQWRRICFTMKGDLLNENTANNFTWWRAQTNVGVVRSVQNAAGLTAGEVLIAQLFKGQQSIDWSSYFTAPLDTGRVTVKYDKTRIYQSGNNNGFMRNVKMWHPMNANLTYDEDEVGDTTNSDSYSVDSKRGMGDYYIVDIISAGSGSTTADRMSFDPEATLYWHEK